MEEVPFLSVAEALDRIKLLSKKMDELIKLNENLKQQIIILEGRLEVLSLGLAKLKGKNK